MSCMGPRDIPVDLLPPARTQYKQREAIGKLMAYSFVSRTSDNHLVLNHLVLPCRADFGGWGGWLSGRGGPSAICAIRSLAMKTKTGVCGGRIFNTRASSLPPLTTTAAALESPPDLSETCRFLVIATPAHLHLVPYCSTLLLSRRLPSTRPFTTTYRVHQDVCQCIHDAQA